MQTITDQAEAQWEDLAARKPSAYDAAQDAQKAAMQLDLDNVTINGRKACVTGRRMLFPIVRELDGPLHQEFAWATVVHVITNNKGAFRA